MRWFIAAAVLLSCAFACPADLTLIENGRPRCVIIAGDESGPSMFAATDLKWHLDRMAGCDVPLISAAKLDKAPAGAVRVFIGDSAAAARLGVTSSALGEEAFRIRTLRDDAGQAALVIVGKDVNRSDSPRPTSPAALYGVSYLLDRQLGVKWLWPGELGTHIPKRATVTIPEMHVTHQPPLLLRSFTTQVTRTVERSSTTRKTGDEAILWNHHHTIGRGRTPFEFGHSFQDWWKKYSATHPEYFAKPPAGMKQMEPRLVKLCEAEPGVARQIVEEWKAAGSPEYWNVCPNDDGGFCTCERCMALDKMPGQTPEAVWRADKVNLAGRYVDLWNRLLREMKKTRSDVKLCTYSYSVYKFIPPGTKFEGQIAIEFVGSYYVYDLWKTWSQAGAQIALRPNWLHFGGVAPHLPLHDMGKFVAFARDNGMLQFHYDSNFGHYATQGPNYYLLARMGTRPDLSVDQIIDEWCSAFGGATPVIRRYLDYWEQYAMKVTGGEAKNGIFYEACKAVGMRDPSATVGAWRTMPQVYPDAVIQPGLALLDEAESAAGGDAVVKARIAFLRDGLRHLAALRDMVALTQGKDKDVKARIPQILAAGEALLALERELTPRHVVYEAVLKSIYEKRGVVPLSSKKPIKIDGL